MAGALAAEGFGASVRDVFVRERTGTGTGRPRRPDWFYAGIGALSQVALASAKPVNDIAEVCGWKPAQVRQWLDEARARGLLSRPPRGRAGGALTPLGLTRLFERLFPEVHYRLRNPTPGTTGDWSAATRSLTIQHAAPGPFTIQAHMGGPTDSGDLGAIVGGFSILELDTDLDDLERTFAAALERIAPPHFHLVIPADAE